MEGAGPCWEEEPRSDKGILKNIGQHGGKNGGKPWMAKRRDRGNLSCLEQDSKPYNSLPHITWLWTLCAERISS